mgnify:CR=1 FL=1
MTISNEKMTFLTANYGLSPAQINAFNEAYQDAYHAMAAEIEMNWEEGGWMPDDPEAAMIECLVDADRLEYYIPDYMDWCFNFVMKQELAHDLLEIRMPMHCIDYLKREGKTSWMLIK